MRRSEARTERREPREGEPRKQKTASEVKIQHDVVNEQVVIAAALVDPDARKWLASSVTTDAFFGKGHAEVWAVVLELERRQLGYDPATVKQLSAGEIDTGYLEGLIRSRPSVPPNLQHHLDCLIWDQTRIEAARGPVSQLLEALRDPTEEPERLQSLARQVSESFTTSGSLTYLRDPSQLVAEIRRDLDRRANGSLIYPTGLDGFDRFGPGDVDRDGRSRNGEWRVVPGFAPKQVSVVTAVPGSGKTTLTCRFMTAQAKAGRRVLCGAWEQGSAATLELCAVTDLGFSRKRFKAGTFTAEERAEVDAWCEEYAPMIRFVELPFGRKRGEKRGGLNDRNLDLIHSYIAATGCDLFVADLWRRALREFDPDEEEVALYRQQAIATETGAHCCLLQQQRSKDVEQRPDRRPTREGIKGSGAWTEVPDTIFGVHLPALWKNVPNDRIEVIILKQRHGEWPLAVEFDWDPDKGQVINGRSVDYARPGESSGMDAWLDGEKSAEKEKKGGRGGSRRRG